MSFQQELTSWLTPSSPQIPISPVPTLSSPAPKPAKLPLQPSQPTVVLFLRHCGCPFAEKTFLNLRSTAKNHRDISFIAISHSSAPATERWLASLPQHGSESSNLQVIVDEEREIYAAYGLGLSSYAHVLAPQGLWSVWKLGNEEGIWNRPTESGSRWQMGGAFGVDGEGIVRWGGAASRADEMPDFEEAVEVLMRREEKDGRVIEED